MKKASKGIIVKIVLALGIAIVMIISFDALHKRFSLGKPAGTDSGAARTIGRIISTAPANTEIIVDLGLAGKLVAIDRYSDGIAGIGVDNIGVGNTARNAGIAENIPRIDFAYPDAELLLSLKPDIIIASGLNRGATGDDPFALLRESGITVLYIETASAIDDIYRDIAAIADALGVSERGTELASRVKAQVDAIASSAEQKAAQAGNSREKKPTVYFEVSPEPQLVSFGSGTFLNSMIECIGAENIFADERGWISPNAEAVIAKNPDIILTNVNYIDDPLGAIKNRAGFSYVRAVQNNKIYYIDNNASSRPSSRIVAALEQMLEAVYGK